MSVQTTSTPEISLPETLRPDNAAQALIALSQIVGRGEYEPDNTDDRSKRLKFVQVERDELGNITKWVKGSPELIEYEHRVKDDSGVTYPNNEPDSDANPHTQKWKIDSSVPRVDIPDNTHHTGNAGLLPHVHESDRGKQIVTATAVKAHQSPFRHIPNFENSPEAWKLLVGRNGNHNIYVTRNTAEELLYGSERHPEWDLGDDTAIDLIIDDLAFEPRPPYAWNYAENEAAKPYISKIHTAEDENGRIVTHEARELKPDELKPSDLDKDIEIDSLVEYFLEQGLTNHQIKTHIRHIRDYWRDRTMGRIAGSKLNPEYEKFLTINKATQQEGEDGFWVRLAAKLYVSLDERQNTGGLQPLEQQTLEEFKKLVDTTSHTGPDGDYRILYAKKNTVIDDEGKSIDVWVEPDTLKPLSPSDVARRQALIKSYVKNGNNMAKYQATSAYEITKQKPYMQAALWLGMMQDQLAMGFTPEEISMVMIGLQYASKPLFLSFKHRYVQHPLVRDSEGNIEYEDAKDKGKIIYVDKLDRKGRPVKNTLTGETIRVPKRIPKADKSKMEFGPIKLRDWATEISQRMPQHGMAFEPGEISEIIRIAIETVREIDDSFYIEGFEKGVGYDQNGNKNRNIGRLSENYLNYLFAFEAIVAVMDNLSYGLDSDPSKRSPEDLQRADIIGKLNLQQLQRQGSYPPKISASAIANKMLKTLTKIVTPARERWPIVQTTRISDNPRLSKHDPDAGKRRSTPGKH